MTEDQEPKTAAEAMIAAVEAEWPITNLMGHEFYCMMVDEDRVGLSVSSLATKTSTSSTSIF